MIEDQGEETQILEAFNIQRSLYVVQMKLFDAQTCLIFKHRNIQTFDKTKNNIMSKKTAL